MAQTSAPTLALDNPAYLRATGTLREVHDDLVQQRRALSRVVHTLLDGGWTGVAADQFGAGWTDWEDGGDRVLDGLGRMHDLMVVVRLDLHAVDDDRSAALGEIQRRLGPRPSSRQGPWLGSA